MVARRVLCGVSAVCAAMPWGMACGQCAADWADVTPALNPPGRNAAAAAYDAARGTVVLYGGLVAGVELSDTWEWTGSAGGGGWVQRSPAVFPAARFGHAMAFGGGRCVMFGGQTAAGYNAETWEWDGAAWARRFPASSPPAMWGHALAYDAGRGRVVLFGGQNSAGYQDQTFEWDGAGWSLVTTPAAPPARAFGAMAYDSARARVVLFGGNSGSGAFTWYGDVWEWDGAAWAERTPASGPPGRSGAFMAYDAARARLVMFGGFAGVPPDYLYLADTWEWDGAAWAMRSPGQSPAARAYGVAAYDAARRAVMVIGGRAGNNGPYPADVWRWGCPCYANCDLSTAAPALNVNDFTCFLNRFAQGDPYANCDGSTAAPALNVNDFTCFLNAFAAGCS